MQPPASFTNLWRDAMHQQFRRLPAVLELTGLKRSTLFAKVAAGQFPKPCKLGERASAWVLAEVQQWIEGRIAARAQQEAQQ